MHTSIFLLVIAILALSVVSAQAGTIPSTTGRIDWPSFLQRSDMVWSHLPNDWDNAPFLGNGNLGAIVWETKEGALRFEVSRSDLYDHRRVEGPYSVLHSQCRLPNGHFLLDFGAPSLTGDMRLDLWDAELRGNLQAGDASWTIRTFTHASMNLIVIELSTPNPAAGAPPSLTWGPDLAQTTRPMPKDSNATPEPYPPQVQSVVDGVNVSVQSMPEDAKYRTDGLGVGEYATAWMLEPLGQGHWAYLISTEFSYPGATAAQSAVANIEEARSAKLDDLVATHRSWWHAYYPKSFLSIPDGPLESFYWIQMYKMGSASRKGGPLIDLQGPWYMPPDVRKGGWPAAWWNLNIQLTYWPFYMANHLDEAEPLGESLWQNREHLAKNAAPYEADSYAIGRATGPTLEQSVGKEVGNLPWTMHNLWLSYRSSMDDQYLRTELFPLMKGSFNYLRHIAIVEPDGHLGLPATASPEYTDDAVNCSYTLACFRWLAGAIIEADARLKTHDPIIAECRDVLARLTPYEIDPATGVMVGKDIPFAHSHRHWSHLFMIYPFHEWNWDDPAKRPLMQQSLDNWTANTSGFAGYSWLGAALMYANAGNGDRSLEYLHTFVNKSPLPNTLYREGSPVIETPLAVARAVQEMLMASYGDTIRVFPGVPTSWPNVALADLLAEGGFLVTAERKEGATKFVEVTSLAGEPLRIHPGLAGQVQAHGSRKFKLRDADDGVVEIDLRKGETVVLTSSTQVWPVDTTVSPVDRVGNFSPWGEKKSPEGETSPVTH